MDQIEQVRNKTDIVELIGSYITLKKAGRNFKALCPFHSEKTPSFIVSPERQIFKCFGCGVGGSVFNFLMEYEKMTFGEALRFLADKTGIKLTSFKPSPAQQEKEKLLAINHLASEFYHYILLKHELGKKGLNYLLQRGINRSSIKLFKLGYAPDAWENLSSFLVKKKGYKFADLEKAGLVIKGRGYYDRFRARIMFPLQDHRENILGFSGRVLVKDDKNKQGAKYVNTPETSIYHKGDLFYGLLQAKNFIKKAKQAVIVEGEFDVISSYQVGVKNVIATKGSALTESQVNLIKRFCQKIILSLDKDTAGSEAIKRGIETADKAGLVIRVAQVKYGKDPDECARHSPKLWRQSVKTSIPVFDFFLKNTLSRFDKKSSEGKKYISEEMIPILAKIQNEVVKSHYLKKLANVLDVDEQIVVKEILRWEKNKSLADLPKEKSPKSNDVVKSSRKEKFEEFVLSLLIQKKDLDLSLLKKIRVKYFKQPVIKKILKKLKEFLNQNHKFKINLFAKKLAPEMVELFDNLYLQDLDLIIKDDKLFKKEVESAYRQVEKNYLKENLNMLIKKIRNAEQKKQKTKLNTLQKKFSKISAKLKDLS